MVIRSVQSVVDRQPENVMPWPIPLGVKGITMIVFNLSSSIKLKMQCSTNCDSRVMGVDITTISKCPQTAQTLRINFCEVFGRPAVPQEIIRFWELLGFKPSNRCMPVI